MSLGKLLSKLGISNKTKRESTSNTEENLQENLTPPTDSIENNDLASPALVETLGQENEFSSTENIETREEETLPPERLLEKSDDPEVQKHRDNILVDVNEYLGKGPIGVKLAENYLLKTTSTPYGIIAQYGFTSKALVKCIKKGELGMFIRSKVFEEKDRHYNKKFDGQFTSEVAEALIDAKEYRILFCNFQYFKDLDIKILHQLIDKAKDEEFIRESKEIFGFISFINKHKEKFGKFDKKILDYILSSKELNYAIYMIDQFDFPELDYEDIVSTVIKKGGGTSVILCLESLKGKVNFENIIRELTEKGDVRSIWDHVDELGVDHNIIADICIEHQQVKELADNLDKLRGLDHKIAEILIEEGYSDKVNRNMKSFKEE